MSYELDITWRHMDPSPHLEGEIRERVEALSRFHTHIERFTVTIEQPPHHQAHGGAWHVMIRIALPGPDIVVSRDPGDDKTHNDVYAAVRDAFAAAKKLLIKRSDTTSGQQRRHEARG